MRGRFDKRGVGTYTNAEVDAPHKLRELNKAACTRRRTRAILSRTGITFSTVLHGGRARRQPLERLRDQDRSTWAAFSAGRARLRLQGRRRADSDGDDRLLCGLARRRDQRSVRDVAVPDGKRLRHLPRWDTSALSRYRDFPRPKKNWHLEISPSIPAWRRPSSSTASADDSGTTPYGTETVNSTLAAMGEEHRFAFYTSRTRTSSSAASLRSAATSSNWTASMRTLLGRLHDRLPRRASTRPSSRAASTTFRLLHSIYKTSASEKRTNAAGWGGGSGRTTPRASNCT